MKNQDIKQFIESVAIIDKKKKWAKPKRVKQIIENEFGEEEIIEVIETSADENKTLPMEITKLKPVNRLCDLGCGEIVTDQIVERRLVLTPEKHWRTHCRNCSAFVHPDGITLIKGAHRIQSIFYAYFTERNK
jgi:hypothetical protein